MYLTIEETQVLYHAFSSISVFTRRCAVSPSPISSMEGIPGDWPLHKESWTYNGMNPAGQISAPLFEEGRRSIVFVFDVN